MLTRLSKSLAVGVRQVVVEEKRRAGGLFIGAKSSRVLDVIRNGVVTRLRAQQPKSILNQEGRESSRVLNVIRFGVMTYNVLTAPQPRHCI